MNPVTSVKRGTSSTVSFVKTHPIAFVLAAMLFAVFLAPWVKVQLGKLYMRGGIWSKVIPQSFTA